MAAVSGSGALYTWGSGVDGQLGTGELTSSPTPILVDLLQRETVVRVSAGMEHTVAITAMGEVFTFGSSHYGQLGHGDNGRCSVPMVIEKLLGDGMGAVGAACGLYHTVIILATGEICSFGHGGYGQLGHGPAKENSNVPRGISALRGKRATAVECGAWHTVAITSSPGESFPGPRGSVEACMHGGGAGSTGASPGITEHEAAAARSLEVESERGSPPPASPGGEPDEGAISTTSSPPGHDPSRAWGNGHGGTGGESSSPAASWLREVDETSGPSPEPPPHGTKPTTAAAVGGNAGGGKRFHDLLGQAGEDDVPVSAAGSAVPSMGGGADAGTGEAGIDFKIDFKLGEDNGGEEDDAAFSHGSGNPFE